MNNDNSNSPKLLDQSHFHQSEQVRLLRKGLKRAREKESVEIVLIQGESGTGKSFLSKLAFPPNSDDAATATATADDDAAAILKHVLFASVKIEQRHQDSAPLAPIRRLVTHVLENNQAYNAVRRNEDKFSVTQRDALLQLLPKDMQHIFSSSDQDDDGDGVMNTNSQSSAVSASSVQRKYSNNNFDSGTSQTLIHAIKLALKTFFQIVLSRSEKDEHGKGLSMILWLDDLMWSPKATLDILQYVLIDCKLKRVLFCATYRGKSNDDDDDEEVEMDRKGSLPSKRPLSSDDEESEEFDALSQMEMESIISGRSGSLNMPALPPLRKAPQRFTGMSSEPLILLSSGQDKDHLSEWIDTLEEAAQANKTQQLASNVKIHKMWLEGLTVETLKDFLGRTLHQESTQVSDLAEFIQFCTQGNLFYAIQLLEQMHAMNHITYDFAHGRWNYSLMDIKEHASLSQDIGAVVASRIQYLRSALSEVLKLSSCFGTVVDEHLVELCKPLLDESTLAANESWSPESILACLQEACEEQLLIRTSETRFRFAHEEIYRAAYNLLPEGQQRQAYHWRIASLLMKCEELEAIDGADDSVLFSCCDQLRLSLDYVKTEEDRLRVSYLFLEAGERAASVSGFFPAADYYRLGEKTWGMKPHDFFQSHHDIAFHLYLSLARAEYGSGKIKEGLDRINFTIKYAQTEEEQRSAALLKLRILLAANRHAEHLEYGLALLEKIDPGEKLSMLPQQIQLSVRRLKTTLKGMSNADLMNLPSKDADKEDVLQILREIWQSTCQMDNAALHEAVRLRIIRIALKNGTQRYMAFVLLQMSSLAMEEDLREASRFVKLAESIARQSSFPDTRSFVPFSAAKIIFEAPTKTLDYCLFGYKACMDAGDIYQAMWCVSNYALAYYYTGIPFQNLIDDMEKFANQMIQYGQTYSLLATLPLWQCLLNLSGKSEDPVNINKGSAMDKTNQVSLEEPNVKKNGGSSQKRPAKKRLQLFRCVLGSQTQKRVDDSETERYHDMDHKIPVKEREMRKTTLSAQQMKLIHGMELAFYFGDLEKATRLRDQLESMSSETGILSSTPVLAHNQLFLSALIDIAHCRISVKHKRKPLPMAMKTVLELRSLCESGGYHIAHKFIICQAELASVHSEEHAKLTRKKYVEGISTAARGGYVQDAALGALLAANFCEGRESLKCYVGSHLESSFNFYCTWGATAVAESIKNRHPEYFGHNRVAESSGRGTGHLNRHRFSSAIEEHHHKNRRLSSQGSHSAEFKLSPRGKSKRPSFPAALSNISLIIDDDASSQF